MDLAAPAFRFWLDGGLVGEGGFGGAPTEGGGGLTGGLGVGLMPDPAVGLALVAQVRELVANERHVSSIGVLVRYPADDGPWVGLGGAHHHELPWAQWLDSPGSAIAATHEDITHRTGAELALGYDFAPSAPESSVARMFRPSLQLSGAVLPATDGPLVYVMARATMRLGVKEYGEARE